MVHAGRSSADEARRRQPLRAPEEHARDARAVDRTRQQDLERPEARDETLDGGPDALVDACCGARVGVRPSDQDQAASPNKPAQRARDADRDRVHEAEVRGHAAEDEREIALQGSAEEHRQQPEPETSSSTAPARYQNDGFAPTAPTISLTDAGRGAYRSGELRLCAL